MVRWSWLRFNEGRDKIIIVIVIVLIIVIVIVIGLKYNKKIILQNAVLCVSVLV
jgi:hypothetical protein